MPKQKKQQTSVSIPPKYWKEIEELYEELKDVCLEFEITSPSKLLRVLAKLGRPRLEAIAEQSRKDRTAFHNHLKE